MGSRRSSLTWRSLAPRAGPPQVLAGLADPAAAHDPGCRRVSLVLTAQPAAEPGGQGSAACDPGGLLRVLPHWLAYTILVVRYPRPASRSEVEHEGTSGRLGGRRRPAQARPTVSSPRGSRCRSVVRPVGNGHTVRCAASSQTRSGTTTHPLSRARLAPQVRGNITGPVTLVVLGSLVPVLAPLSHIACHAI